MCNKKEIRFKPMTVYQFYRGLYHLRQTPLNNWAKKLPVYEPQSRHSKPTSLPKKSKICNSLTIWLSKLQTKRFLRIFIRSMTLSSTFLIKFWIKSKHMSKVRNKSLNIKSKSRTLILSSNVNKQQQYRNTKMKKLNTSKASKKLPLCKLKSPTRKSTSKFSLKP